LRPEEHAGKLPPDAGALKRILMRQESTEIMKEFRANDGAAQWAQRRYKLAARIALCVALAATMVGASFLVLPTKEIPPFLKLSGTGVEYFLLFVAFLAERYNARRRPYKEWMTARARAEILRGKI